MGLILRQPDPNPESGPAASVPADPAVPTPLTRERVIALFKERGWRYFIDSEGDLGGIWDDATFYFFFHSEMKEIFWIHAKYPGTVNTSRSNHQKRHSLTEPCVPVCTIRSCRSLRNKGRSRTQCLFNCGLL